MRDFARPPLSWHSEPDTEVDTIRRHRILVADDNFDSAQMLAQLLSLHGYEVQAVFDGRQAIDAAARFEPDLVILDLRMPVVSGFEAARELQHAKFGKHKFLLVALTGLSSVETRDEAHAAGFDMVIPKTVDGAYLCDLVQGLLDTHSLDAHDGDPLDQVLTAGRRLS